MQVLNAYSVSPAVTKKLRNAFGAPVSPTAAVKIWLTMCPYCNRLHSHGAKEGPRTPHCPHDDTLPEFEGRERPSGYVLRYAGEATISDWNRWQAGQKEAARRIKERAKQRRLDWLVFCSQSSAAKKLGLPKVLMPELFATYSKGDGKTYRHAQ